MQRYFLTVIFLLLYSICIFSQTLNEQAKIDSINNFSAEDLISNLRKSKEILENNLQRARDIDYKLGIGKSLSLLGEVYYLQGEYDKSNASYFEALRIFNDADTQYLLASCYGKLGYQIKRRDLTKANRYLRKAIDIAQNENLPSQLKVFYDHYGVLKEMEGKLDSAKFYYTKSLEIKKTQSDNFGIPYSLNNLAGVAAMEKDFTLALALLRQSDFYRNKEESEYGRSENLVLYADLYKSMEKYDSAIVKYKQCIESEGVKGQPYIIYYCYENLSKIYQQLGRYEDAFYVLKSYTSLKDSVLNFETNSKIAELEIDYETEKKNKQIALSEIQIQEKSNQLTLATVVIISLTLISIGIYKSQKQKSDALKKEIELKEQVEQAELERKLSEEKLKLTRELHDNIGSQITFLISSVDNLQYLERDPERNKNLERISEYGRKTLTDLRNTIWAMKLEHATFDHLITQLKNLKQQIVKPNLEITSSFDECTNLSAAEILNLFRIAQEAIQNSVKYADGSKIHVSFKKSGSQLLMTVTDDGKGFDIEENNLGNGIANMKERAQFINADFTINSNSNGTEILVTLNK